MNKWLVKKFTEGKRPVLILICGMAGTRKSSTAVLLAAALRFATVIGMDEIRDVMRLYDRRPIIQGRSHNRWRLFGKSTESNFAKGFLGHCRALRRGARAIIRKNIIRVGENTMIEGVHLLPSLYQNIPEARVFHILLIARNHAHHKELLAKKFDRRHGVQKAWLSEKIWRIEKIQQNFLIDDARKHNVAVFVSTTPEENCEKIVKYLVDCLKKQERVRKNATV